MSTPSPDAKPKQWTGEDVDKATPAEVLEAMDAGLLRDLGIGPTRHPRTNANSKRTDEES